VASPSGAVFEGIARHYTHADVFRVAGEVSRINRYGNTSACIESQVLRKYCYCL
jgi:hypothetical protein